MSTRNTLLLVALAVSAAGCAGNQGRLKGRVVENGQPITIDGQAALMFYQIGADGKPNPSRSYPIPLSNDGSFELVASGGEVPAGTYLVSLEVNAPKSSTGLGRFKGRFTYPESALRHEVKAGANEVTIDLAKPGS
jgi:hypothetical protein